ncbi:PCP degradation transcriptional activation protein [Paraglaciecola mesophila]|uniref:PCP degradation transcriptional activation protein n=1 Tax=Paraglaciecola mesophila TaxID=197222 RepID=A0A857JH18_9ALTE|nr:LysR family transcriptional regulator [Paraglaciecola mesophila]QHJ10562.1 PCP degradation transcriptional activation protein [Paraglaciecola mesophila]
MLHSKIDLNLFLVLVTVYQEGSITGAGKRLHLSQPAVSHALSRLREKFQDPLFIRHGRKMIPTELCQTIMPRVRSSVAELESTLRSIGEFDVHQYQREMKFGFRDILESIFFPELAMDLLTHTPNITVNSRQVSHVDMEAALENQELDIVIDVLSPTSENIQHTLICNEHFSLICRQKHPILTNMSLANYIAADHALVRFKDSAVNTVDMALAQHGVARKFALTCEHYFAATSVISRCDMLLTMPNAYARLLKQKMPVEVVPLPFDVPVLPVHMYWHKQAVHDPLNSWMRTKLLDIAKRVIPASQLTI